MSHGVVPGPPDGGGGGKRGLSRAYAARVFRHAPPWPDWLRHRDFPYAVRDLMCRDGCGAGGEPVVWGCASAIDAPWRRGQPDRDRRVNRRPRSGAEGSVCALVTAP
ncbi:hypothetical protein WDA79_07370 [Streptomyces sp. A475]|uniref:hypothetical protein n=1 Tax=Streptomyces sp. A475 TaxID=3131976 RepID=UPI0030C95C06